MKWRLTRSGDRGALSSRIVVRTRRILVRTLDRHGPHQPGDLIAADVVAVAQGRLPNFVGAVDAVVDAQGDRLSAELVVLSGVDTLAATGARLVPACEAFDIDLVGAHSALADARATALLFLRVASRRRSGSATVAPHSLPRSGRIHRRNEAEHEYLPDPPLIVFLASRLTQRRRRCHAGDRRAPC